MSKPKDFTYDELKQILNNFGFYEDNKGKTSGSKVIFKNIYNQKIGLHKPHPSKILKSYQIDEILRVLNEWRIL
jgi:predicted RNA binding protein YcfA (HicA-like mRNA interferase family)